MRVKLKTVSAHGGKFHQISIFVLANTEIGFVFIIFETAYCHVTLKHNILLASRNLWSFYVGSTTQID